MNETFELLFKNFARMRLDVQWIFSVDIKIDIPSFSIFSVMFSQRFLI